MREGAGSERELQRSYALACCRLLRRGLVGVCKRRTVILPRVSLTPLPLSTIGFSKQMRHTAPLIVVRLAALAINKSILSSISSQVVHVRGSALRLSSGVSGGGGQLRVCITST